MDEQLKQELIALLRDMKSNASPVFQELVAQRSGYYTSLGTTELTIGIVSLILSLLLGFKARAIFVEDNDESLCYILSLITIGLLFLGVMLSCFGVSDLFEGLYPLSKILGMLR